MMTCREYKEIIAAHVDGALSSAEMVGAESHLSQCEKCRRIFLWEVGAKKVLKPKLPLIPARPGLREKLLDRFGEREKEGFLAWVRWPYLPHGLAAAFALSLIIALPYFVWRNHGQEMMVGAIEEYRKITQGVAGAEAVPPPSALLLNLTPWGYQVLARRTVEVKGREGRLFVYQGQEKEYLLAQEFEGLHFSPPSGAKTIRANRDFVTYSRGGINLVAWKEKDKNLVCILASALPEEKLLDLAKKLTGA